MSEPLLTQLSERLARPVGESDRQRARLHLLDWLACVAGARKSEVAGMHVQSQSQAFPRPLRWLANILEMDDVHRTALLHPGPVIWGRKPRLRDRANDHGLQCLDGCRLRL